MKKDYETPRVKNEAVYSEPVETGCCLRSCGGVPHHPIEESIISEDLKKKFESIK